MKIGLIAAVCAFALAGCSSEYSITTSDGQMLTSDGKPRLDKDTGMSEFTDSQGRKQQIPQSNIKQMLERCARFAHSGHSIAVRQPQFRQHISGTGISLA